MAQVAEAVGGVATLLNEAQAAAARGVMSSGSRVSVLIGPAGSGKSFTAGALQVAWQQATGGRVIGLAVSQNATEVLRDDGLSQSMNIAPFLAAQEPLADGTASGADRAWVLNADDVVFVDEASMVGTAQLTPAA